LYKLIQILLQSIYFTEDVNLRVLDKITGNTSLNYK